MWACEGQVATYARFRRRILHFSHTRIHTPAPQRTHKRSTYNCKGGVLCSYYFAVLGCYTAYGCMGPKDRAPRPDCPIGAPAPRIIPMPSCNERVSNPHSMSAPSVYRNLRAIACVMPRLPDRKRTPITTLIAVAKSCHRCGRWPMRPSDL